MAIIETSRPVPFGAVETLRVVNLFESMRESFVHWRNARATEKVLCRLSNDQLEDIGITRAQIQRIS